MLLLVFRDFCHCFIEARRAPLTPFAELISLEALEALLDAVATCRRHVAASAALSPPMLLMMRASHAFADAAYLPGERLMMLVSPPPLSFSFEFTRDAIFRRRCYSAIFAAF